MTGFKNFHFILGPIQANHRCFRILAAPKPANHAAPFSLGSWIVTCFLAALSPLRPHRKDDRDEGRRALGVSGLDVGEGARDRGVGLKPRIDGGGDSCVGMSLSRGHDRMLVRAVVCRNRVRQWLQLLVLQEMTFRDPRVILGI